MHLVARDNLIPRHKLGSRSQIGSRKLLEIPLAAVQLALTAPRWRISHAMDGGVLTTCVIAIFCHEYMVAITLKESSASARECRCLAGIIQLMLS
jgi:hypothetical protein